MTLREQVFERDHGVCSWCQADTQWLGSMFSLFLNYRPGPTWMRLFEPYLALMMDRKELWEMDHIIPRRQHPEETPPGFDIDSLGNLRTLCVPCHRERTRIHSRRERSDNEISDLSGSCAQQQCEAEQARIRKEVVFTDRKDIM